MTRNRQSTLRDHFSSSSSPVVSRIQTLTPIKKRGTSDKKKTRDRSLEYEEPYNNDESSSDVEKIQFESEELDVTTEDDSEDQSEQPTSPIKSQMTHRTVIDSASELEEFSGDEKGVGVRWLPSDCKRIARTQLQILDSNSEDDELSPRKRRKIVKGVRPPSDEDERDLLNEVDQEQITETRLRKRSNAKTSFQKNLDKLKRKKAGQSSIASASEESAEDASESDDEPFPDAYPDAVTSESVNDLDDEDEDFIVHDDERGPFVQLPAAFSMSSHQDLSYHFKTICQYFVHIAVASDKRHKVAQTLQEDEYFSVPFHFVRRKTSGIRDTVASSVWRPEFKKALLTYPNFDITLLDFSILDCDACHMGGRLSTFVGRVSGEPYDKVTFEPLDESSHSSEEDIYPDDDIKREFNMGRFCARRSRIFHKLVHWEYALYNALTQEVEELNVGNAAHFVRIAYARGKKPPKDVTDPDKVMEWLDERGIIAEEWTKLKDLIEASSNLDARGDDDIF